MGLIIDIALVLIIVIFLLIGLKKGAIQTLFQLFGWIVALALAIYLSKYLADYIYQTFFVQHLIDDISDAIRININDSISEKATAIFNTIPEVFRPFVNVSTIEELLNNSANSTTPIATTIVDTVISPLIIRFIKIICILVLYAILLIILKIIATAMDIITKLPVLKQSNELLGAVFGLIKGAILVLLIVIAIETFQPMISNPKIFTTKNLNESIICNFVIKNNPFNSSLNFDISTMIL